MSSGLVLVVIPCVGTAEEEGCGQKYATEAKEGEHVCPDCGAGTWLFEFDANEGGCG